MASRSLSNAHPVLVEKFEAALKKFKVEGRIITITCTHRSTQEQQGLYAQGRTKPGPIVTKVDGVTKLSKHNYFPSQAIDFAVVVHGKISWDPAEYEEFGALCEAEGLEWGGRWIALKDYPHIELKSRD